VDNSGYETIENGGRILVKGVGFFINLKANALEMAPAFVVIVLLALFGIVLVNLVTYVENRFCNW